MLLVFFLFSSSLFFALRRVAVVSGIPTDLEVFEMAAEAAGAAPSFVQKFKITCVVFLFASICG